MEYMTEEDLACPILALAPQEYTYWEKRVWRRGVLGLDIRGEVPSAVSARLKECKEFLQDKETE